MTKGKEMESDSEEKFLNREVRKDFSDNVTFEQNQHVERELSQAWRVAGRGTPGTLQEQQECRCSPSRARKEARVEDEVEKSQEADHPGSQRRPLKGPCLLVGMK